MRDDYEFYHTDDFIPSFIDDYIEDNSLACMIYAYQDYIHDHPIPANIDLVQHFNLYYGVRPDGCFGWMLHYDWVD